MSKRTPTRPHLFKAYYNWCVENNGRTYIIILSHYPGVVLPPHVKQSEFTKLCIRPDAIVGYQEEEYGISFTTRFNGTSTNVYVPYGAIQALTDSVLEVDIHFVPEESYLEELKCQRMNILNQIEDDATIEASRPPKGKPYLTLVK